MAGERTIKIRIDGDSSGLVRAGQRGAKQVGDFDQRVRKIGRTAAVAGVAFAGLAAVWIQQTGAALVRIERLNAQTNTVIKSMGAAWTNTEHITNFAGKIEELSGIEAENVQEGQNLLLTYGQIQNRLGQGNDIFDQATTLMTDLSVATGKAMPEAANLLGKALNDPLKGLTALTRVGIQFTEQQKTQIAALIEAGDVMGAQKIILAELQKQFGGSAAAFGETTAGQVLKLQNRFGELSEELLVKVLPAFNGLLSVASAVVDWISENQGLVKTLAIALAGLAATWLLVAGSIKLVNGVVAVWNVVSTLARGNTAGLGAGFTNLSTAAKVASLSMGAIGVVATVIGTALSIFGGQSAEAEARQQELAAAGKRVGEAIAEQNGVIDQNIRMMAAKEAADAGLLKIARELGISGKLVVDAILGEGNARQELNQALDGQLDSESGLLQVIREAGGVESARATGVRDLKTGVDDVTGGIIGYQEATEDSTEATGGSTAAIEAQITALEDLIEKQREAAGIILDQRDAERELIASIASADEAFVKNGATLDRNTQQGRDNEAALDGIVNKTFDVLDSMVANGAGNDALVAKMTNARAEFVRVATRMGLTEQQANELADSLGLIPGTYAAKVVADTQPARNAVNSFTRWLDGIISVPRTIKLGVDAPAGGGGLLGDASTRATGGPVLGGRSYLVGERGPEIFKAPNSGTIIPNHMIAGGGDVAVYVSIDGQQLQGRIDRTVRENNRSIRRGAGAGTGRSR